MSLPRAFWEYAIIYGTVLNIITTAGMFATVAMDAPVWLALTVHLLAAPYNLFAVVAVWRSASRYRGPEQWPPLARIGVVAWAVIATAA